MKIEGDPLKEEAVFIGAVNTSEDPPNAHQAQHRPKPRDGGGGSLFVKLDGDPLNTANTQYAQHRSVQATDR